MSSSRYTDLDLIKAINECTSIAQTLRQLGLKDCGSNYKTINRKIKKLGIDTSHFLGQAHLRGKSHSWTPKYDLEEIMQSNSDYSSSRLKDRLIKEGVFEHRCNKCGRQEWLGRPIPLEIEHINGISTDNRKNNLELLCPNCHAFTSTYRGKNIGRVTETGRREPLKKVCPTGRKGSSPFSATTEKSKQQCKCGKEISRKSKLGLCQRCYHISTRKIERPDKDKLLSEIREFGFCGVARKYGVSDNAIRKWVKTESNQ